MTLLLFGARVLLSAVFLAAAVSKLRDRGRFRETLVAFGVPAGPAGVASRLIPAGELAAAVLLLPATSAWWGAVASLALLTVFTAAIAATLARGRTPDCACFGSASGEPIGLATIARNLVLSACALLVVVTGPGPGLGATAGHWAVMSADERVLAFSALLLLIALVLTGWGAGRLRASNARLSSRIDALEQQLRAGSGALTGAGLPRGTPAPPFDLPRLEGDRLSLATLREAGRPILLIFSNVHCQACGQLWPDIGRWQQQHASTLTVGVICGGPPLTLEMKVMGTGVTNVLLPEDASLSEAYGLTLTPSAVIVDANGRIDSDAAEGVPAIRTLVAQRTHTQTTPG